MHSENIDLERGLTGNTVQHHGHEHPSGHKFNYGGNPLAHVPSASSTLAPPFASYLQPGLYHPPKKSNIGNPVPLGLCGFALTTFVQGLLNFHTRNVSEPSIVLSCGFAYGGLIQICAGMWEMAIGNTFGATALTSYGGYWISLGIILTPGGFAIQSSYPGSDFASAFAFFLFGWMIFTFLLWTLTLKSTVLFSALFFFVWVDFLVLGLAYIYCDVDGNPDIGFQKAGGMFGLLAAFIAWYVALAGIADGANSFFVIPVWHFPWSEKGRPGRGRTEEGKAE